MNLVCRDPLRYGQIGVMDVGVRSCEKGLGLWGWKIAAKAFESNSEIIIRELSAELVGEWIGKMEHMQAANTEGWGKLSEMFFRRVCNQV